MESQDERTHGFHTSFLILQSSIVGAAGKFDSDKKIRGA